MAYTPSWLYPLKGIYYLFTRPFLWSLLKARLLPCFLLSVAVLGILFFFTFLPQLALLAIFQGRLAWPNTIFLVLGEGAAMTAILFEIFFVDETQVDIFDAVLIKEGSLDLVTPARGIDADAPDPVKMLGKPTRSAQFSPFSFRLICEFVLFLPFNLIPVVGTPIFLLLTGRRAGPFYHWRYFALRGLGRKDKKEFVKSRRLQYTWFGTVALVLQLLPVLSMLFLLTTAAGAALWAADLEKARSLQVESQAPSVSGYVDDPV